MVFIRRCFLIVDFICELLFEVVFDTIVEFAEKRKRLGLALFLILAVVISFLAIIFLIMTVKNFLKKDFMYAFIMIVVFGIVSICTYSAWKKVIQHLKRYYFTR